jgi:hypothetical protein
MKLLDLIKPAALSLVLIASSAFATEGSITITSPANGAVLQGNADNKLDFNVKLSPTGNHLHIYVDDGNPIIDRDISHCPCSITLPKLSPGKHVIAIKEATVSHALTGVEAVETVTSK